MVLNSLNRRDFLKQSALASGAALLPRFLSAFENVNNRPQKILVVIQLSGGNDGLNTVVPFGIDSYYSFRPTLGIQEKNVLKINQVQGLHPAMKGLKELYDDGMVSIVNEVGYPNPNRSHFRSMDIWQSASHSDQYLNSGWIGRYLDHQCNGCDETHAALELDGTLSMALKGESRSGLAASSINQLKRTTRNPYLNAVVQDGGGASNETVNFLYKQFTNIQSSAKYLSDKSKVFKSNVPYPANAFGKDLKMISQLIQGGSDTRVYYVSLGGFDTHAGQKGTHQRLLNRYSKGVAAFVKDLKRGNMMQEVAILTFSEFGRRVKQNGSGGTDHGAANNVFLIGSNLKKPGIVNAAPNLKNLKSGDLKFNVDFRSIYQDLLNNWMQVDSRKILNSSFEKINIV